MSPGIYRLEFRPGMSAPAGAREAAFFDRLAVDLRIDDTSRSYHVPLLLAPFSLTPELVWRGQWELVGWQNTAITAALLLVIAARAARTGYSPLVLVSERADAAFIATLGKWRAKLR